jgi:hypothetical protein
VEWIGSGADRAAGCGPAHVHHARHADVGASAAYIAAAVDSDTCSGEHVAATLNADAVFEFDAAAANGLSESAQLCHQRT